jgi:hypothetical protein
MLKPFLSYLTVIYITLDICYIPKQLSCEPKEFKVVIFSFCHYKGKEETAETKLERLNRIRWEISDMALFF